MTVVHVNKQFVFGIINAEGVTLETSLRLNSAAMGFDVNSFTKRPHLCRVVDSNSSTFGQSNKALLIRASDSTLALDIFYRCPLARSFC